MDALERAPAMRTVNPIGCKELDGFSCGAEADYEIQVNEMVDDLRVGNTPETVVRLAEDAPGGDLIGLCGFREQQSLEPADDPNAVHDAAENLDEVFERQIFICVIAISEPFRRTPMPDGVTRIGLFLLDDALRQIEIRWGSRQMPTIWALIGCDNVYGRGLCDPFEFELESLGPEYDLALRAAGVAVGAVCPTS